MKTHAICAASAIVLAAATLTISTTEDPAIATSAPREWDVGAYDACMKNESEMVDVPGYPLGSNTIKYCCDVSGGVYNPDGGTLGTCGAPPAVAADASTAPSSEAANPDVPAAPPPPKPAPKPVTPRILGTPTTTTPVPVG